MGRPHAAVVGATELAYGRRTAAGWVFDAIDPGGWDKVAPCLAVSPDGRPHVVFDECNVFYCQARYAVRANGTWAFRDYGGASRDPAVAVDSRGAVHLAITAKGLQYETSTNGTWQPPQTVASAGERASISVDAADRPVIAYYDADLGRPVLAERSGGTWRTEAIDDILYSMHLPW